MKRKIVSPVFIVLFFTFLLSCSSDDEQRDEEKPTITLQYDNGFPQSCTELKRGQRYTIRVKVSDNKELASYGIDIHHNFDHHTHDDQGAQCTLGPIKKPVKPMIYMKNNTLETGKKSYEIVHEVQLGEDIDVGDYHCQISVTDITGWQARTSVDIKIVK